MDKDPETTMSQHLLPFRYKGIGVSASPEASFPITFYFDVEMSRRDQNIITICIKHIYGVLPSFLLHMNITKVNIRLILSVV